MFKRFWASFTASVLAILLLFTAPGTGAAANEATPVLSRAAFVYGLAVRLGVHPVSPGRPDFSDVAPTDPYYGFVEAAYQKGWVNGRDGAFHPADPLTRAEMAKVIVLALDKRADPDHAATKATAFKDDAAIPLWARGYINEAVDLGILKGGSDGAFNPGGYLTVRDAGSLYTRVESFMGATMVNYPLSVGPSAILPATTPTVVTIMAGQKFVGDKGIVNKVTLPEGKWAKVVMSVYGTQQGRQYDRTMQMWADSYQIFLGTTPEPTKDGIAWHFAKDISAYLPILTGERTFTTELANYTSNVYTGVPQMTVTLEFYPEPASGTARLDPAAIPLPSSIIPVLKDTKNVQNNNIGKGETFKADLTVPRDVVGAYLDLYVEAQNNDEFWWSLQPSFREVQVSIDGKPAGVIWPSADLYTGGVNPYLWRPIVAVNTFDLPSYRLDLTPFAGVLGGEHKLSISVQGNENYWKLGGSLFVYQAPGEVTSGSVTVNTLTFPTDAKADTTPIAGSKTDNMLAEKASKSYKIQGTIVTSKGTATATVESALSFSGDQLNQGDWQVVHTARSVNTVETHVSPSGQVTRRENTTTGTLDATAAFTALPEKKGFVLPSDITQTLDVTNVVTAPDLAAPYRSSLHSSVQSYATLQRTDKDTTAASASAYSEYRDSFGRSMRQNVMARGGVLVFDRQENHMNEQ